MPLYKKGDPSLVSNYWPISITSTLYKIMETIIKDNLMRYVVTHNVININKHGFVLKRSTCIQLLETRHDWCSGMDNCGIFDVITLDFSQSL